MVELLALIENQQVATGLFITGVVLISAWLLMRIRKRTIHGSGHTTAREVLEQYKQRDGLRDDLQSLMVEIEQLAKRVGAQLDAKAMRVEKLIDDADLRIAQLQKAMHDQHASPAPPEASPEALRKLPGEASPGVAPGTLPEKSSAGGALKTLRGSSASAEAGADGSQPTAADVLAADVCRLADEGLAPADIARRLDEHVGKVELILALRQP